MRVLSRPIILAFIEAHPDAAPSLLAWYREARRAEWATFAEVRESFASDDRAGELTVFSIAGNKYRLVAHVRHDWGKCFVRHIFTHAEYDDWNRDRR